MHYWQQKGISLGIPLVFLIASLLWWPGSTESLWTFLWMVLIPIGYTHYILGAGYQIRAFKKSSRPGRLYLAFAAVTTASILFAVILMRLNPVVFIFTILTVFIVHGIVTEDTLWSRGNMPPISSLHFYALGVPLIGVLLLSLPHASTFFTVDLNAQAFISQSQVIAMVSHYVPLWVISWGVLVSFGIGLVIGWIAFKSVSFWKKLIASILYALGVVVLIALSPLPNAYLQFVFLAYHFILWGLFYGLIFSRAGGQPWHRYCFYHVIILIPLWGLAFVSRGLDITTTQTAFSFFFSMQIFTIATTIHIMTSFLNESGVRRLLRV